MASTTRRRVWLGSAGALLAVSALALGAAITLRWYWGHRLERAIARYESSVGSLDSASYAPPPVEDGQNVATALREGARAMTWSEEEAALVRRRAGALGEPWPDADVEAFAALLAAQEPARDILDRAATLVRSGFEIDYSDPVAAGATFNDEVLALLRAGRLLAVECDFHQRRGELDPALAALHVLERITAALRAEPLVVALIAGTGLERMYLDRLEVALSMVDDTGDLRSLHRDLRHLEVATVPATAPSAVYVAALFAAISRESGDRTADVRWAPAPVRRLWAAIELDRQTSLWLESIRSAVENTELPFWSWFDPDEYARQREAPNPSSIYSLGLPSAFGPDHLEAIKRDQWTRSSRALGRLAVDLRLSRLGHGSYPAPPEPATLPVSAAAGEKAVYTVLDDGSIEIAFPEAEATWEEEKKSWSDPSVRGINADFNLRWRLPP